jgi:hypothetical protein
MPTNQQLDGGTATRLRAIRTAASVGVIGPSWIRHMRALLAHYSNSVRTLTGIGSSMAGKSRPDTRGLANNSVRLGKYLHRREPLMLRARRGAQANRTAPKGSARVVSEAALGNSGSPCLSSGKRNRP